MSRGRPWRRVVLTGMAMAFPMPKMPARMRPVCRKGMAARYRVRKIGMVMVFWIMPTPAPMRLVRHGPMVVPMPMEMGWPIVKMLAPTSQAGPNTMAVLRLKRKAEKMLTATVTAMASAILTMAAPMNPVCPNMPVAPTAMATAFPIAGIFARLNPAPLQMLAVLIPALGTETAMGWPMT